MRLYDDFEPEGAIPKEITSEVAAFIAATTLDIQVCRTEAQGALECIGQDPPDLVQAMAHYNKIASYLLWMRENDAFQEAYGCADSSTDACLSYFWRCIKESEFDLQKATKLAVHCFSWWVSLGPVVVNMKDYRRYIEDHQDQVKPVPPPHRVPDPDPESN